jgi:hypothetical protein
MYCILPTINRLKGANMAKKGKKRVSITVTAEQFDRVSSLLDEGGYPAGYLSFYLDRCIGELESVLTGEPTEEEMTSLEELKLDLFLKKHEAKK